MISLLGDPPHALPAAGRVLSWHQPDPGRHHAARLENVRIGDGRRQRACRDRPDSGRGFETPAVFARPVPGVNALLGVIDLVLQRQQLPRQPFQAAPRQRRDAIIVAIGDHREQLLDLGQADPRHNAELRHVCPERIDQHGSLANQELARPMHHQHALPFSALHRDKAHGRPCDRLADRLRIGRIVLVTLHIGLYIARWHQLDLMTQRHDRSRPVMRRGAGLHADQARRLFPEKRQNVAASQLLADYRLPRRIDAVDLKNALRKINPDRGCCIHSKAPL